MSTLLRSGVTKPRTREQNAGVAERLGGRMQTGLHWFESSPWLHYARVYSTLATLDRSMNNDLDRSTLESKNGLLLHETPFPLSDIETSDFQTEISVEIIKLVCKQYRMRRSRDTF